MKKVLVGILIIVSAFFVSFGVANAALGFFFGGRILNTEAIPVTNARSAGYDCIIPGSTIEIYSLKGPTSYFIPAGTIPVTNTTPNGGQQILGIYSGQTTITCTRDEEDDKTSSIDILLDTISYFGTSQY